MNCDSKEESDGDGDKGGRRATLMEAVTKRVIATVTTVASNKEGNDNGGMSNGDGNEGGGGAN